MSSEDDSDDVIGNLRIVQMIQSLVIGSQENSQQSASSFTTSPSLSDQSPDSLVQKLPRLFQIKKAMWD